MSDISALLERCRALGAILTPLQGRIRVRAPRPLPDDVMAELREAKAQVLNELHRQLHNESECWLLEEWRRQSIPEWRRILHESMESKTVKREEYARWMLREILLDPDYEEAGR